MFSKIFLLAAAFQVAATSAQRLDPEINEDSAPVVSPEFAPGAGNTLTRFLQSHIDEPGFGTDGNNVTNPGTTLAQRGLATRALGNAVIANRCSADVWLWSVDQNGSKGPIKIKARSKYTEKFRTPCNNCGVSLKISRTNQLKAGQHTQFEYAIANNIIYYDISYVDCAKGKSAANCPGHKQGHMIDSAEKACGLLKCKGNSYCPTQAYYVDQPLIKLGIPEPVKGCGNKGTGMNIWFTMCSDAPKLKRDVAGRLEIDDVYVN